MVCSLVRYFNAHWVGNHCCSGQPGNVHFRGVSRLAVSGKPFRVSPAIKLLISKLSQEMFGADADAGALESLVSMYTTRTLLRPEWVGEDFGVSLLKSLRDGTHLGDEAFNCSIGQVLRN